MNLSKKDYLVIVQCDIVKERCPGYLCEKAFHERTGGFAENRLRNLNCPKINLQVRSSNKDVIAFYESVGFTQDDVVSLGKRLDGPKKT